jgi:hypothetical protein
MLVPAFYGFMLSFKKNLPCETCTKQNIFWVAVVVDEVWFLKKEYVPRKALIPNHGPSKKQNKHNYKHRLQIANFKFSAKTSSDIDKYRYYNHHNFF